MKAKKLLSTILAFGLSLTALTSAGDVLAQKNKKTAVAAPPAAAAEPPMTKKPIALQPAGLAWGMSAKQVAELVDKVLDEDYKPLYKSVSPGVKMKALDAQLAEDKNAFRRSRIDFGKLPTGIDSTPLRGEYTYLNKESLLILSRQGQPTRNFFFIQDRLWKIIDEHKLVEGSPLGKGYQEAVVKLVKVYGVAGRVLEADYEKGRNAMEVDWKDPTTHLRAIMRGDTAVALAYEDNATLSMLATLRPNKPPSTDELDPAVAAAMGRTKQPEPPIPPAPPEKAPKKK